MMDRELKDWSGYRTRRGDMAPILLHLLLDQPMHGYEMINRLSEKTYGFWRPSAGSVYPNLQLLEEQELVTHENVDGKKVYHLTDKGKTTAKSTRDHFQCSGSPADLKARQELKQKLLSLKDLVREVGASNDHTKIKQAKAIIKTASDQITKLIKEK